MSAVAMVTQAPETNGERKMLKGKGIRPFFMWGEKKSMKVKGQDNKKPSV